MSIFDGLYQSKPASEGLAELSIEVVSKRQIMFESKAQADEKPQHT